MEVAATVDPVVEATTVAEIVREGMTVAVLLWPASSRYEDEEGAGLHNPKAG
jgi:hypothetical protein